MKELVLDRHLLASNATTYDTAWGTYGWTPTLEGARASRLEEQVPWGTRSARLERPPRLSGPLDAVLSADNLDRLGRALLPVDGRLGFSLWGAVGEERVGSEWRVATHTLLMDPEGFRALEGYPDGLLAGAAWFRELVEDRDLSSPAPLAPVRVAPTPDAREALAAARLGEIGRLRSVVLAARGGDRATLAAELGAVYEALAAALQDGPGVRHVALRVGSAGPAGADPGVALLRLVWLSLPLEDRARVAYVTEQRRAERPPAHLLGLTADEWGRYVPDGAWVPGESEPVDGTSPGRRHWAETLAADDGLAAFRRLDARAALRGWRIVAADDLRRVGEHERWRRDWGRNGPSLDAATELVERERGRRGGPRAAAVGDALGRAVAAGAEPHRAAEALAGLGDADRERAVRGAVRALREAGRPGAGGLLRADVTARFAGSDGPLVRGLRRLVDREAAALRALLEQDGGPAALVAGAFASAAAGDPMARELVLLGAAAGPWRSEDGVRVAEAVTAAVEHGGDGPAAALAADFLAAVARERAAADEVEAVSAPLLDRFGAEAVVALASALADLPAEAGTEALRRAAVARAAGISPEGSTLAVGADADEAVEALLRLGRTTAPPASDPGPWRDLLERAPATWLARPAVLAAFAEALDAGARPPGEIGPGADVRPLASLLARRVLERTGPGALDDARAAALLRLMWLEGDGSTPAWIAGTRADAAPALLGRLLVAPAPLALVPTLRAAFTRAVGSGADVRGLGELAGELRAWAPALAETAGLDRAGERFLPLAAGRA